MPPYAFSETDFSKIPDRNYSKIAFPTVKVEENQNIKQLLEKGIRTFIISQSYPAQTDSIFKNVSYLLSHQPQSIITLIITDKNINPDKLIAFYGLAPLIYKENKKGKWDSVSEMIKKNTRLVIFSAIPSKFALSIDKHILFSDTKEAANFTSQYKKTSANTLLVYNPASDSIAKLIKSDTLFFFKSILPWKSKGFFPTFLITTPELTPKAVHAADSLNNTIIYSGEVKLDDKLLDNVYWSSHNFKSSNGDFSFPKKNKNYEVYSPWKAGYKFYPEVAKFENNYPWHTFIATKLELKDDMVYFFSFEKGIQNDLEKKDKKPEAFKISMQKERERGKVAVFNTEGAAIQCENNTKLSITKPITIAAWINPKRTDIIQTIVSMGEIFSAKLDHKNLTIVSPSFRYVHVSAGDIIKVNKWQHVTFIYVPNFHLQYYINGKLIYEAACESFSQKDRSITIGNNFSNETFYGKMDELTIWNRALSQDEILELYNQKPFTYFNYTYIIIVSLILLSAWVYFLLKHIQRKKAEKNTLAQEKSNIESVGFREYTTKPSQKGIFVFGPLSIINHSNENLAIQLTPKVKQLFILLLLNRYGLPISTINEELWPGADEEKAKQNRNYTIQQLKKTLSKMEGVELVYQQKKWLLEVDNSVYVDIYHHEFLYNSSEIDHQHYLSIVNRGKFLQGVDFEMLDIYKAKTTDQIIEQLLTFSKEAPAKIRNQIGNALLQQDSLNEEGLALSIKALVELGRNGEAQDLYSSFQKRFKNAYNEDFSSDFSSFF